MRGNTGSDDRKFVAGLRSQSRATIIGNAISWDGIVDFRNSQRQEQANVRDWE